MDLGIAKSVLSFRHMPAPQRIKELVENFKANFDHVQSADYKEEDLRNNFLNPFFQELGWDMEDKVGKGPMRDVHYEKIIKTGAPDYGFYTDGRLRFFVEAKNPSVNVCTSKTAAFQLRSYGWSAKVPRCILTDFEELSIYDTTVKPKHTELAHVARIEGICIKYTEFIERWDEIAAIFSREAVMAGSLEKLEKKNAKQAVDKELLVDISNWRELLAKNIANRNQVSEERLNRIVQDTIARILFLRICEDRRIAPENDLAAVIEGDGAYIKLYKLFKKAEQRYDSDLFEVESIANLVIDDKILKEVISELYFPKSPYKFDAIPSEILGQVYEQFLGKVIRLTEGGHAKVEEKPEVRKAGGIYYTPTYIVEYIVQNTVGKLVEGETPKKIETLSIVDPACGSGSFLLGAYKFLAIWYRDWYSKNDADKHAKAKKIYRDKNDQWQLTLEERKRILTAHIYGVDIDRQAVELTKLSLMLEALGALEQNNLFNERMLPRLGDNIKLGNSLVASDFSDLPDELIRVHAFDWQVQFEKIINAGGFDIVIGNPPYIQLSMEDFRDDEVNTYLKEKFGMSGGRINTFILFIEKARLLTKKGGVFGFIVPNTLLTQEYYEESRKRLLRNTFIQQLITPQSQVFSDAVVENIILIARILNDFSIPLKEASGCVFGNISENGLDSLQTIDQRNFVTNYRTSFIAPLDPAIEDLRIKLNLQPYKFGDLLNINQAIALKHDRAACLTDKQVNSEYHEILDGRNIRRYFTGDSPNYFKFDIAKIHSCKREDIFLKTEKILMRRVGDSLIGSLDEKQKYALNTLVVMTPKENCEYSLKFMLGIFNSKLMNFYYTRFLKSTKKVFSEIQARQVGQLPVPKLDLKKDGDKARHDRLVLVVDKMLDLMPAFLASEVDSDRATLQNAVTSTDKRIDELVYELYGLTDEEKRVVEES